MKEFKIHVHDRHGEHAHGEEKECSHGDYKLRVGEVLTVNMEIGAALVCSMEVHIRKDDELEIIANHLDWVIERAKQGKGVMGRAPVRKKLRRKVI